MTVDSTTLSTSAPHAAARRDALDRIDTLEFPTKRDEAWRYAPHALLGDLSFGESRPSVDPFDLSDRVPDLGGPLLVIVNGVFDANRSTLTSPTGVRLMSLAEALVDDDAALGGHFDRAGDDVADAYELLNVAFGGDGALLDVADGVIVEAPIHIVSVEVPGDAGAASCAGVVIRLGVASRAQVVETRLGVGSNVGGSNLRTSVALADDAVLEHIIVQDVPSEQVHLSRVDVVQGSHSVFRARSFNLGASYGRLAYEVRLSGTGASADLSGLYFGDGAQVLDQQINVVHDAKDCVSRQSFRGVLDGESTGVFNGGIAVRPGADGTDAAQTNDNLLLSGRCEINTQPRLEILADEVACTHGATVGQLDETAMYYMRSRGIGADEARRLLINGFADQTVDEVDIEAVRTWVTQRLGHGDE